MQFLFYRPLSIRDNSHASFLAVNEITKEAEGKNIIRGKEGVRAGQRPPN